MTEDEAKQWCAARFTPETVDRLSSFAELVIDENNHQNLIAPATCSTIWSRHITDSAQLLNYQPEQAATWIDIGTGAGFPGMIVAFIADLHVTLIEPRARRVDFLRSASQELGLTNVSVVHGKAEAFDQQADVISARAVASLPALLTMTCHLRHATTRLILPRGRNGASEIEQLPHKQRHMFHVEQSVTSGESVIIVADGVTG